MQNYGPTWLNESYYQNIPHNEESSKSKFVGARRRTVNWAQLAQQWIAMRDRPEVHTSAQSAGFQQYPQDAVFPPQFAPVPDQSVWHLLFYKCPCFTTASSSIEHEHAISGPAILKL
uniref:Uncharacterized protein n=1 Tax=Romanomermis culicivorax TaxID=13658 RepID=A0A915IUX3_ROMCU